MDKYAVSPDHSDGGTSIRRPGECTRVAADLRGIPAWSFAFHVATERADL
jgi:hypothetical protein